LATAFHITAHFLTQLSAHVQNCLKQSTHTYTDTYLMASFPGQPGKPAPERWNQSEF